MATWKDSVRAATTGNINLSGTPTIDGVQLNVGDRVLVKDQAKLSENGIYVVATAGWSRAPDANTSALMESQMVVRVSEGNVNGGLSDITAGTEWTLISRGPIFLGTSDLMFLQTNLLKVNLSGYIRSFQGNTHTDTDVFTISNNLQAGQSGNPQAYLATSLAGYSFLCTVGAPKTQGLASWDLGGPLPDFGLGCRKRVESPLSCFRLLIRSGQRKKGTHPPSLGT